MKTRSFWMRLILAAGTGAAALSLMGSGCELESSDDTVLEVGLRIAGQYANPDGAMVDRNSGSAIQKLTILQSGDRLTGVDNNGIRFTGRISTVSGSHAVVVINGNTTAGATGQINAEIVVSGTSAVLRGTWTEPSIFSSVYGEATVEGVVTTPTTNTVTLTP